MKRGIGEGRICCNRTEALDRRSIVVRQQIEAAEIVGDVARISGQLAHLLELRARLIVAAERKQADGVLEMRPRIGWMRLQGLLEFSRSRVEQLLVHELRAFAEMRIESDF